MRRESPYSHPVQSDNLTGMVLETLLWPVRLLLAAIEALFTEVVAWLIALPGITWDAIHRHRRIARQRAMLKQEARLMQLRQREAMRLVGAPFLEGLRLIEEFDRRQAALAPRFISSLQSARALCDAIVAAVPELAADPAAQQRLHDALNRLFRAGDA